MLAANGMTKLEFIEAVGIDAANEIASVNSNALPIIVFAGPDQCGAIALATARHLHAKGERVHVFLFNIGGNRLSDECQQSKDNYIANDDTPEITEVTGMRFSMPELDNRMLIVDGLFGSSITGPLSRGYQILVSNINDSGAKIISIDCPSGLPGNPMSGLINSKIIHATLTLAVTHPRLSFFINENIELVGQWKLIGPRPDASLIKQTANAHFLIEGHNIRHRLKQRLFDTSKNDYGSAILFAGSYGMMGAAVLATRSASRSGCGRVTCHAPACGYQVLQTSVPSAMFECDPSDKHIKSIELHHNHTAVAIGPGIGTDDHTIDALEAFLKISSANQRPVILDADALNCLAIRPSMLDYIPVLSILTPHASEFDRLFGRQPSSSARLSKAIEVCRQYRIIIVLKGYYTATVRPDGKVFFNSSGTPALATAGTGDVLTGLMTGFMGQGMKPEIASIAAVYVHGIAGRISERIHGSYGTTAEDVAENIGRAIKSVMEE